MRARHRHGQAALAALTQLARFSDEAVLLARAGQIHSDNDGQHVHKQALDTVALGQLLGGLQTAAGTVDLREYAVRALPAYLHAGAALRKALGAQAESGLARAARIGGLTLQKGSSPMLKQAGPFDFMATRPERDPETYVSVMQARAAYQRAKMKHQATFKKLEPKAQREILSSFDAYHQQLADAIRTGKMQPGSL